MTATNTSSPSSQGTLRRATYVDVKKLVSGTYDINFQRLQEELATLRAKNSGEPKEEHGIVTSGDSNDSPEMTGSMEAKPWSGKNLSVLPGGPLRYPHSKYHHQSRLQPPRDGFNLCVLVGKVEVVVDKARVDGSRILVAEVEVGDETGTISLRARDEQIDLLRQVSSDGGAIVLRNSTLELYQGKHLRVAVSKWGKMSLYPDGIESTPSPPSSMNHELNFSLVDLNLVAVPKMPSEPAFPVPVATVHHKPQRQQYHSAKHFDESSGGRGNTRNRGGRSQGGHYQKKKKDDWQYHNRQHQYGRRRSGGSHQYPPQHQQGGGGGSPPNFVPQMHYQYSDTSSVYSDTYSYPSQQGDQQGGSPQHRQFLPNDHYKRQQQILYQQFELQQRMQHMIQQQQESQRQMLGQHVPDLNQVESHESGEYPAVHSPVGGIPTSLQLGHGSFSPTPGMQTDTSPPQPMQHAQHHHHPGMNPEYQYGSALLPSPPLHFQGEGQQPRGDMVVPTYATIISPPISPEHTSYPAPQAPPQYEGSFDDHQHSSEHQE